MNQATKNYLYKLQKVKKYLAEKGYTNWLATRILAEQLLARKQRPIFIFGDVLLINGEQIK